MYYGEGRHFENVSNEDKAVWLKVLSNRSSLSITCRNQLMASDYWIALLCSDVHVSLRLLVSQDKLTLLLTTDLR